jgi:hypothetical protein
MSEENRAGFGLNNPRRTIFLQGFHLWSIGCFYLAHSWFGRSVEFRLAPAQGLPAISI